MPESLKKIILWNYERGTWQYDVFCLLIIAFIFLTPKEWFEKREKLTTQSARSVVKAEDSSPGKIEIGNRVRKSSGNPNPEIFDSREKKNKKGEVFHKIEIR